MQLFFTATAIAINYIIIYYYKILKGFKVSFLLFIIN